MPHHLRPYTQATKVYCHSASIPLHHTTLHPTTHAPQGHCATGLLSPHTPRPESAVSWCDAVMLDVWTRSTAKVHRRVFFFFFFFFFWYLVRVAASSSGDGAGSCTSPWVVGTQGPHLGGRGCRVERRQRGEERWSLFLTPPTVQQGVHPPNPCHDMEHLTSHAQHVTHTLIFVYM